MRQQQWGTVIYIHDAYITGAHITGKIPHGYFHFAVFCEAHCIYSGINVIRQTGRTYKPDLISRRFVVPQGKQRINGCKAGLFIFQCVDGRGYYVKLAPKSCREGDCFLLSASSIKRTVKASG